MTSAERSEPRSVAAGVGFAAAAYLLWGVFPLYFLLLAGTDPIEIVAWRIVLSVAFCALLLVVVRGWGRFLALWRDRRAILWLTFASIAIAVNWTVFIMAVTSGHVVETALGYFINPILTVLAGVILLRERLRPLQWAAVGVSAVAVVVLTVGYGSVPWIALVLATSWAFYGFAKHHVGPKADAIGGFAAETAILTPVAVAVLFVIASTSGLAMGSRGAGHVALLLCAGFVTAIPLILFAAGARRVPLSYLGLLQYLAPVLQFLTGVLLLREPMPTERWVGFGIVWVALILLTVDTVVHGARSRRRRGGPEAVGEVI